MNNPAFIRIHQVQNLFSAGVQDLTAYLLGEFLQPFFLPHPEEFAIHLNLLVRDFVQYMLQGQEQRAILPQQELLVVPVENDIQKIAFLLDLEAQLQWKMGQEFGQELGHRAFFRGLFGPGPDDNLPAFEAEQLGLLGDDLIIELGSQDFQHMFGVGNRLFQVLALELRYFTFFFYLHWLFSWPASGS